MSSPLPLGDLFVLGGVAILIAAGLFGFLRSRLGASEAAVRGEAEILRERMGVEE